ncbi:metallophosphoesterase family protein [Empedobacter brevis]
MIQIAIISDIHGNIVALNEVLADIKKKNISHVYCLGDLVDFAPWSNEVISFFRNNRIPCILGNHDERIAFDLPIIPLTHHDDDETENRIQAINHSKQHIISEHKEWLSTLPYQLELVYKIGKSYQKILLVHASLDSNEEYVNESDEKREMYSKLKEKAINVLVMGHTHQSYIQQISDVLFVNSGSVGRSKEEDRKATYCVLTLNEHKVNAEIVKVDYSVQEVISAIYASEIPNFYGDFLAKDFNL